MAKIRTQPLAKLARPRLHNAVQRGRLLALLDGERAVRSGIWVIGPPGAGKTTLVASWLDARDIEGIWYQVDSGDCDLAAFFHYLARAAEPFARRRDPPLPAFTAEYLQDPEAFARRFFRMLFARLPAEAVLVLDNYQDVPPAEPFHAVVAQAAAEAPPGACVVAISRSDLPDTWARLAVSERVGRIDWSDLRLTLEEASSIAGSRSAREPQAIRQLHDEVDGWAAGLTLLLERGSRPASSTPRTDGSHQLLFDYFASQVFEGLAPELQRLLVDTALPDVLPLAAAQALSGTDQCALMLEDLCARRLFVQRRSGSPPTYQYHALFRGFLRSRLQAQRSLDELSAAIRRTADVLAAHDEREQALELYRDACAWAQAEALIVALAPQVLAEGRWRTVQAWCEALPPERLQANPWALYWAGMSHLQGASLQARDLLRQAHARFAGRQDALQGRLLCAAGIVRSCHFQYNTFQEMDPWIEQIDRDLEALPCFERPADELAVHTAVLLVTMYRQPGHARRAGSLQRVSQLLDAPIDENQRISSAFVLLLAYTLAHENRLALGLIERIAPLAEDDSLTALNRSYWWLLVGYFQHRHGARAQTEAALDCADRIAGEHGLQQPEFLSRCYRAQHCCTWNDLPGARRALAGLERFVSGARPMACAQYHKQRFFYEMRRGNAGAAAAHAKQSVAAATSLGAPFFDVAWLSQGAAALAMNGEHALAAEWLDRAWGLTPIGFLATYRPMVLASRAYLASCMGDQARARSLLQELFAVCSDEDAFSYVGTVPVLTETILTEALCAGIAVPLVRQLVRKYRVPARADVAQWPWPVRVYTLGAFRIEVNGEPVQFSRKTPRKVLLLLKALVAMGGTAVPQRRLIDALWADEDGDAAADALSTSLHRLRRLLDNPAAIAVQEGTFSIDRSQVWVDSWQLEQLIAGASRTDGDEDDATRAIDLYRGHFLDEDDDIAWTLSPRERIRTRFFAHLAAIAARFEAGGNVEGAAALYQRGIELDELSEGLYQGLMRTLVASGRIADALLVYRKMAAILQQTLGTAPSAQSLRLYRELTQPG